MDQKVDQGTRKTFNWFENSSASIPPAPTKIAEIEQGEEENEPEGEGNLDL